jgi:crossover junction endodeoxyribonuclease RuvC
VRVLGVDPGTVITGWGVIDSARGRLRYVASGVIEAGRGEVAARLALVYSELCGVIARHAPEVLSLERNFLALNVQSAFRLGEARGVAMAAAAGAGVRLFEYTPAMIKKAVVGHGRADKAAVTVAVSRLLAVDAALRADEADALAAAACHGFRSAFSDKLAAALRTHGGARQSRRTDAVRVRDDVRSARGARGLRGARALRARRNLVRIDG